MKTALIKTSIWDDDIFYEMHLDTKLIYLLLLTSPERGVGRIFKMSDRLISARSGLNNSQITVCKKQLSEIGLVHFNKGWILLTDESSFIQPVRGRLTQRVLEKEIKDIPNDVFEHFTTLTDMKTYKLYRSGTGTVPELDNDKDNDNDSDDDKDGVYDFDNDKDMGYKKFRNLKRQLTVRAYESTN